MQWQSVEVNVLVAGSPPFLSCQSLCFLLPALTWGCLAGCESFKPWLLFVQGGPISFTCSTVSLSQGCPKNKVGNSLRVRKEVWALGGERALNSLMVKGKKLGEGVSRQPGEMKSGLRTESVLGPSCLMHLWPFSAPRTSLLGCLLRHTQELCKPWPRSYQGHHTLTKDRTNTRAVLICEQWCLKLVLWLVQAGGVS